MCNDDNKLEESVPNNSSVFVAYPHFPGGRLKEKTSNRVLLKNVFYGRISATYHDAHQKYTHPAFEK